MSPFPAAAPAGPRRPHKDGHAPVRNVGIYTEALTEDDICLGVKRCSPADALP
jgi:hypothetical protein